MGQLEQTSWPFQMRCNSTTFARFFSKKGLISDNVLPIIQAAMGAASRTIPSPSEAMPKQA